MTDTNDGTDWIVSTPRRRVLAASATFLGGGTALALGASESGRASVSVDELSVADATFDAAQIEPVIDAEIGYAFRYDAPTAIRTELRVGDDVIASEELRTGSSELENTTSLSGRVTDAEAWSPADFAVEPGASIERTIDVSVRFAVLDGDSVVVEETASDTATVEVTHPEGEQYARVGGNAEIRDASSE